MTLWGSNIGRFVLGFPGEISEEPCERRKGEINGLGVKSGGGPADEGEMVLGPTMLGMEVVVGGSDPGVWITDLLLTGEGSGRSGALGRKVSALASRKALCKEVSLMNLEAISCDLG